MSDCLFLFKCLKTVLQKKCKIFHGRPIKTVLDLTRNSPFFLRCGKGVGSTSSVKGFFGVMSLTTSVKHLQQCFRNQTL